MSTQLAIRRTGQASIAGGAIALLRYLIQGGHHHAVAHFIREHYDELGEMATWTRQQLWDWADAEPGLRDTAPMEQGPRKRTRLESSTPSLSNTPATTTMDQGAHEGGEEQHDVPHDIWVRFPNHQFAKLKWIYTNFLTDNTSTSNITRDPFDQADEQTTTALLTTGGGVVSTVGGANTLGVSGTGLNASGHDYKYPVLTQLRMTTPYNIIKTITGNGLQATATGNSQPNWLEMFDTRYQFYHVLECDWRIDFNFGAPWFSNAGTPTNFTNQEDMGYYIFWKYTSNDTPPTSYAVSNNNIANVGSVDAAGRQIQTVAPLTGGSYTNYCTPDDYFRMRGFHSKHVSLSSVKPTHVTISGKYKYGQCKMDIKTQEPTAVSGNALQTEGWLQAGSTYTFPEDLTVIIVADNAMNANTGIYTPVGYRMSTEHLIEFKDLRSAYKFPTPAHTFINSATTLNTDAMFFNKGAAYT